MAEKTTVLEEFFGEHPLLKIVDFLIENKIFDYSKKQIMQEAGVSKATFFKYFRRLEEGKIVKVSRKFGKTKLYQINEDSPVVKKMVELGLVLAREAAETEAPREKALAVIRPRRA